ncbi:hypothetical protein ILUMI_06080 [Ignelater luminosus]|uniref:Cytochrome P450 n=1 Tax=Ignelater luminosus TaxID=2038154 RepID=A0A8K0GCY0_IGNLU|nr:hypothetical protein ILUMI_06080 [Ignelater luminosus]
MEPVTIILLLMVLTLPTLYLFRSFKERKRFVSLINQLPGPPAYPILGTALDFLRAQRKDLFLLFRKRSITYSPLFRSWYGSTPAIHLMKPEHMEVIMNNSQHIKKDFMYQFIKPWLGEGLLTGTGAKWHKNRKLITPTFHFQILENFVEVFEEKSQMLVNQLSQKADGKVFDIYPFITHCALDIICETAMGVTVNAMSDRNSEYVQAVYGISEVVYKRNITPWMHPDLTFYMSPLGRRFQHYLSILHGFTNKVIRGRKVALKEKKANEQEQTEDDIFLGKKKRKAFLDLLIISSQDGKLLTDTEIREEVDTFMFEGHDTTTAGICWSLFLLGNHPDVQEKVFEELDGIFQGEDRPVTMADLGEMKYLERVIKESLRLYPSVPFISRMLNEDIELDGYILPAGCAVILQIYDTHRNIRDFPDPERFDPDRFLPENTKLRHPYAYVPFSAGPRNCIGQKFAILEEKTVISSIIRKFKIRSLETQDTIKIMSELILRPQEGIKLTLEPRVY